MSAGLIFGTALALGAYNASQSPPLFTIQLCSSSILAGVMGYRFYNSGKVMPAGIICALSCAMIGRIALKASGVFESSEKPM